MAAEQPKCRLERVAADVTNLEQRAALFASASGVPTLMITEGLLMYLAGSAVEALAAEAARSGMLRWLLDSSSLDLARMMGWDAGAPLKMCARPATCKAPP